MGAKTTKNKINERQIENNERAFKRNLYNKGILRIREYDNNLLNPNYTEQQKNQMINSQATIALNNYNELISKSKQDYIDKLISAGKPVGNTAGKGLEEFLLTYGKSIIKKITLDKSEIHSNDNNPLIPYDNLKQYASIDLYNNNYVIECKEYTNASANSDDVVLQDTKLCGDHNYNLVFNSDGKIIKFNVKNPTDKKVMTEILPPNSGGRDYIVLYRLDDGLYSYNVTESIKNYIKSEAKKAGVPLNTVEYEFNYQDIKTGKLGASMYDDGRRIVDGFGQPCFIVKKKYLHKISI
jgi:hypothetical protein